jgi:hypothetical protein
MVVLKQARHERSLDKETGRFAAGGLKFSDAATSGKNYGFDAQAFLESCGGTVLFTKEDEDLYDSIYGKAAGEYYAAGCKSKDRVAVAEERARDMKSGFRTLQTFLEDRGVFLYRIQGRGNLVTVITINPGLMVQARIDGQYATLTADEAYERRQIATAEGNIARAVDVISAVSHGNAIKVNEVVGKMVVRGVERAKERQESRISVERIGVSRADG